MTSSLVYSVEIERQHQQHLTSSIVKKQINYIVNRALAGNRGKHWKSVVTDKPTTPKVDGFYTTTVSIKFRKISGQSRSEASEWHHI